MHSFEIFHEYERGAWSLRDIPWDKIERARLKPEDIRLVKSAVMGECNSVAALHGFLNESVSDYDFAAYASLWGAQELQHHFAFRTYLQKIGEEIAPGPVEATRPPYPPGVTHAATLATNIISELTVCHVYHQVAKAVEEPVLRGLLARVSQDEARHAREFLYYARRRLERHPGETASVLETLYIYVGDPDKKIKHPVSVFKGKLPELANHETIDDGFDYFLRLSDGNHAKLTQKLFQTFSALTGCALTSLASIRRALVDLPEAGA
jgi:rubrerythrin